MHFRCCCVCVQGPTKNLKRMFALKVQNNTLTISRQDLHGQFGDIRWYVCTVQTKLKTNTHQSSHILQCFAHFCSMEMSYLNKLKNTEHCQRHVESIFHSKRPLTSLSSCTQFLHFTHWWHSIRSNWGVSILLKDTSIWSQVLRIELTTFGVGQNHSTVGTIVILSPRYSQCSTFSTLQPFPVFFP